MKKHECRFQAVDDSDGHLQWMCYGWEDACGYTPSRDYRPHLFEVNGIPAFDRRISDYFEGEQ